MWGRVVTAITGEHCIDIDPEEDLNVDVTVISAQNNKHSRPDASEQCEKMAHHVIIMSVREDIYTVCTEEGEPRGDMAEIRAQVLQSLGYPGGFEEPVLTKSHA
jgi:hypothetical protein